MKSGNRIRRDIEKYIHPVLQGSLVAYQSAQKDGINERGNKIDRIDNVKKVSMNER